MSNKVIFKDEAKSKMLVGIDTVANAVKLTLGPKGRNVVRKLNSTIHTTKDGVTVAHSIEPKDQVENIGAKLICNAAYSTVSKAGDGTTTSIVLSQELIHSAYRLMSEEKVPFLDVKKAYEDGLDTVNKFIETNSIKIDSNNMESLTSIASISANNDKVIGAIVADAVSKVGQYGNVRLDYSVKETVESKYVPGYQFDRGVNMVSFANGESKLEFDDCYVLISRYDSFTFDKMTEEQRNRFITEIFAKAKDKALVFIGTNIQSDIINSFVTNRNKGLRFVVVNYPLLTSATIEQLKDIELFTGAKAMGDDVATNYENITFDDLGHCEKAIFEQDKTVIIQGHGNDALIENRIKLLKDELDRQYDGNMRRAILARISQLSVGACVISVGGSTEIEIREKYDRIEDSVNATKAAIECGILPGAGTTLLYAGELIKEAIIKSDNNDSNYNKALLGFANAIQEPFKQILFNSYLDHNEVSAKLISENKGASYGFNALTGQYANLIEDGVIDPAKVTKTAMDNAVSVAIQFITTDCVIIDE